MINVEIIWASYS